MSASNLLEKIDLSELVREAKAILARNNAATWTTTVLKSDPPTHPKHGHYFKDTAHLNSIDIYRVLQLFGVTDQAIGHAAKKLLVAGGRGAGKSIDKDIQEAIDTLVRWQAMRNEDRAQDDGK